jgi:tetratricopeptide (TPR) repeat protein
MGLCRIGTAAAAPSHSSRFADAQLFLAHLLSNTGRHKSADRRARTLISRGLCHGLWKVRCSERAALRSRSTPDEMLRVEPDYWTAHVFRMQALIGLRRYEDAVRRADEALELRRRIDGSPRPYPILLGGKGYALARMGRHEEARAVLDTLRRESAERYVSLYHEATVLVGLGQYDEAMSRLEAAVPRRDFLLIFLGTMHTGRAARLPQVQADPPAAQPARGLGPKPALTTDARRLFSAGPTGSLRLHDAQVVLEHERAEAPSWLAPPDRTGSESHRKPGRRRCPLKKHLDPPPVPSPDVQWGIVFIDVSFGPVAVEGIWLARCFSCSPSR